MKNFRRMSAEEMRIELATAVHERECAKLAALFGQDVTGWLLVSGARIMQLRKLLAEV